MPTVRLSFPTEKQKKRGVLCTQYALRDSCLGYSIIVAIISEGKKYCDVHK